MRSQPASKAVVEAPVEEEAVPEELEAIPEVSEREDEAPRQSISMDTWHRYQYDRERYE